MRITGKWIFPKGSDAPAQPEMELFDYRDQANARFVMDFWLKKGLTVTQAKATRHKEMHDQELRAAEEAARKRAQRRIASLKAMSPTCASCGTASRIEHATRRRFRFCTRT